MTTKCGNSLPYSNTSINTSFLCFHLHVTIALTFFSIQSTSDALSHGIFEYSHAIVYAGSHCSSLQVSLSPSSSRYHYVWYAIKCTWSLFGMYIYITCSFFVNNPPFLQSWTRYSSSLPPPMLPSESFKFASPPDGRSAVVFSPMHSHLVHMTISWVISWPILYQWYYH